MSTPPNIDTMTPADAYRQGREDMARELLLEKAKLRVDESEEEARARDRRIAELEAKVVVLENDAGATAAVQADLAHRMMIQERKTR